MIANPPPPSRSARRRFLQNAGICLGLGGFSSNVFGMPKNEMIRVGVIGCGGRMRRLIAGLAQCPGADVAAVCDVWEYHRRLTHAQVGGLKRAIYQTSRHEELVIRKDIDAVIVATPNHWHAPIAIDALEAGKHVYVETPLFHKLEEAAKLIDAKDRTKLVVQVGGQQRSMPHLVDLKAKLASGEIALGNVHRVHMQWCRNNGRYRAPDLGIEPIGIDWKRFLGNAPPREFDPFRFRSWRWFWDYGSGPLGDLMVHWIDVANWLLDLPMPDTVVCSGGNYERPDWETPDTVHCLMGYLDRKMQLDFSCTFSNNNRKACVEIMGTKATLYLDRGRYEVREQRRNDLPPGEVTHEMNPGGSDLRGLDDYPGFNPEALHLADWLRAIRENQKPANPLEAGVQAATACLLGNVSFREQRFVFPDKDTSAQSGEK